MLFAGDELSHTKNGNNNTYCQDNELAHLNWNLDERKKAFLNFVRKCTRIWQEEPVLRRSKFFQGRPIRGGEVKDITFFSPDGQEMTDEMWNDPHVKCIGVRLAGDVMNEYDERGEPIHGNTLLLLINSWWERIAFTLPTTREEHIWEWVLDTWSDDPPEQQTFKGGEQYALGGRALALLRTVLPAEAGREVTGQQVEQLRREAGQARRPSPKEPPLVS
jgi:glycogen operon protein